jgi:hypothetical protein
MAKKRESGQTASAWRWLSAVLAGSLGLGATLFSGCSQTPVANAPQPADPLHGVLTPPGMPQPASAPKTSAGGWNPAPSAQFGVADSSSTNNATLAGMTWQGPLGKPLAIDDSNKTQAPGQLTTGGKAQQAPVTPGFVAPNPNPKVEPIPDAKPPQSSWQPVNPQPTVQTVAASSAPTVNPDVLGKQLQDRGVINQKVDQVPEGIKLTCYLRRPDGGLRIPYAIGVDYNSAAQAMVELLDKTPQQP